MVFSSCQGATEDTLESKRAGEKLPSGPGISDQGAYRLPGRCSAAARPGINTVPQASILALRMKYNIVQYNIAQRRYL